LPFCPNCGREIPADAIFCPSCGRNLRSAAAQSIGPDYHDRFDSDASTAKTLTLAAIIVQVVFFIIGIVFASFFFAFVGALSSISPSTVTFVQGSTTFTGIYSSTNTFQTGSTLSFFGIFALVFGIMFVVSIVWIVLDYLLVYRNLSSAATIANAKTPALVLGIIQLVFGGFIPGILLIAAYLKIEDSFGRGM
jgi:hypothetical protein